MPMTVPWRSCAMGTRENLDFPGKTSKSLKKSRAARTKDDQLDHQYRGRLLSNESKREQ